ncbi:MAG: hypothetical protein L0Y72_15255 [Gemmataceae bacterium]|nr:hypothetical protein [Gemmataceae bacterium]MCI0740402.1 hypothetical protein [Gemmataceae bacterium]
MNRWRGPFGWGLFVVGISTLLIFSQLESKAQQEPNFDRLSAEDRQALQKRFAKELWPLLTRHERDGCVGCHAGAKTVSALRMTGDIDKDFPMLIKQGFFIPDDAGSLLARMLDKDPKRIMPPPAKDPKFKRPHWTEKELALLRAFVVDLDKKQKK